MYMYTIICSILAENHCPCSMDATNNHFIWALPILTILVVLAIIIRYVLVKKHCPSSKDTASNLQSTASHSSPSSSSWDVFLSFRGKDTRRNFVANLYSALDQAGIQTFRDDPALRKGEEISSALHDAIRSSQKFIVVISENYARSSWCLDELVEILSCNRTGNQVIPVFYYVHPSDVRYQKGSFREALDFHRKFCSVNKIKKWRSALAEIADLAGHHLKIDADENESHTIRKIVEDVALQVSTKMSHLDSYLVGIDWAVERIYKRLSIESNDFRVIGFYGMRGIGKTTTAKAFYNKYLNNFDISCLVENVKQNSKGSNPLLSILEQLLSELLREKDYRVHDVESGIRQLKRILSSKKALIALDDLDQSSHAELLVMVCNLCCYGSRVIVTTTDVNLLKQLRVDVANVYIHHVKELDQELSLQLFSYHAFRKTTPPENLRELSVKIVNYVGGLPLALKVLGSSLRGRPDVPFWKDQLEKVRVNPKITKILERSYDELGDKKEKAIFLDIVFFFIGQDVNEGFHVFKSCKFCPEAGIQILLERCLLTIDQNNRFQMHSLIQDMGREVILAEAKHGKSRRLQLEGNACLTLQNLEGSDTIEGLILNLSSIKGHVSAKIFERLPNLRLLEIIDAPDIKGGNFENSFHELRCIRWSHCPWTRFPDNFRPQKLVSLDMPFNKFKKLPKGIMNLKTINVSYSKNLKATSDLRDLKLVEKLVLRGCKCLLELHPSIGQLASLSHLDLGKCNNLKALPESIGQLTQLSRLDLDECEHLTELPEAIGQLTKLENLELLGCRSLKRLPQPIKQLANLVRLDMSSCHNLERLPEQLGNMKGLKMIDVSDTAIEELPDSIVHLKKLVELRLIWCTKLRKLPERFGDMEGLGRFDAHHSAVEQLPDSFGRLINLVSLQLYDCKNLVSLPNNIWKLELLRQLRLSGCSKLKQSPEKLGNMQCLESLDASLTSIEELPDSIGQLSRLRDLTLNWCNKLKYMPNCIGNLTSLASLDGQWEAFRINLPDTVKLTKLESLNVRCNIRLSLPVILEFSSLKTLLLTDEGQSFSSTEPVSLSKLSNLQRLSLCNCTSLGSSFPELPSNIKELYVYNHATLEHLPDSSNLKQLKALRIWNCISLQSLPSLPIHLNSLEVDKCPSLHDPPDLSMLKELRTLEFRRCSGLNSIGLQQSSLQVGEGFSSGFTADIPNRKIAEWFSYKSRGNTICFDIPPDLGDNFLGVALWLVYTCKTIGCCSYIRAVINNKTEGVKMNWDILVRPDTVGEVNSRVECIRRDAISTNVQSRLRRYSGERISMKSGDRVEIQFQSLLYFYDAVGSECQCGEVKVETCGAHVIQKHPSISSNILY